MRFIFLIGGAFFYAFVVFAVVEQKPKVIEKKMDEMNLVRFAVLFDGEQKKWDIVEVHVSKEVGLNPDDLSKWAETYLRPNFRDPNVAKIIFWSFHEDQYYIYTKEQIAEAIMEEITKSPESLVHHYNQIFSKKISCVETNNGQPIFKVPKND